MVWLYGLTSVTAVSLVSLIGVLFLVTSEERLRRAMFFLVALAAGALFGDVLIHIAPELFADTETPTLVSVMMLTGILLFFVLEKFLHWRHSHLLDECQTDNPASHQTIKPVGPLILVSDGLHNFLDGVIIGVAYLASLPVGLATTIAVILHEIPQEISDFAILIHAGFTKIKALLFNLLSASLAIIGALFALTFGQSGQIAEVFLLPLAAGGFLYIAGSDLVPELHKTIGLKQTLIQFSAMVLGISLMLLLLWLE